MTNITNEQTPEKITEIITEKKIWDFEGNQEDKLAIVEAFKNAPDFRILQYINKFFIEIKKPNLQSKYNNLEDCYFYEPIKDSYLKEASFNSLKEAEEIYIAYRTKPIIHQVPDINFNN